MRQESERIQTLGKWLWRRYVMEVRADNPAGAIKHAEGLFYTKYQCDRKTMLAQWDVFETELFKLANSAAADEPDAHKLVLGF